MRARLPTTAAITASAASMPSHGTAFHPSNTLTSHARITPAPIARPVRVATTRLAPLRPIVATAMPSATVIAAALTEGQ